MKNQIGALNAASTAAPAVRSPAPAQASDQAPASAVPNVRLVIEEDQATGDFIYTTLDRSTGEVLLQLPRKEVMKKVAAGIYSAGDVFKARA